MGLPADYSERVYAGVLGKIIGVYLGRPFEGWTHQRIMKRLGPITSYVHDKVGVPLIVADDDISGTLTFLRAFEDHGLDRNLTPQQIGETWLNYLIEERTILWWGGMGNSTEHTAYLRLKHGIEAPRSGSAALNGKVVSEQIGAQIFVDGWAMIAPGDPELAADFAKRAGSVSHDGEAIYGAQMVAAMEAEAFVASDVHHLIDTGLQFIPRDSIICRLIEELRELHQREPDWLKAREWVEARYGYDKYGGNCHMVPNHGLIILSLLYGEDNFSKALEIVNTCGWDTDCNSANVGCLFGIKNGLAGLETGPDWRGPVADRILLASADAGRGITDALREATRITQMGMALAGVPVTSPKEGARFHFSQAGSVQGFALMVGSADLSNVEAKSGSRVLELSLTGEGKARAETPVFLPPFDPSQTQGAYDFMATPLVNPGDLLHANLIAPEQNEDDVSARLYVQAYDINDQLVPVEGPVVTLAPGRSQQVDWVLPQNESRPMGRIGIELIGQVGNGLHLDWLTWDACPKVTLTRPELPEGVKYWARANDGWRRAWVNGVDDWGFFYPEPFRLIQNEGCGLLMYGTREWKDYTVEADVTAHMADGAGIAARVQGMRRYYALVLRPGNRLELIKCLGELEILAWCDFEWAFGERHDLVLEVRGGSLRGLVDGEELLAAEDDAFKDGGIALLIERGRTATEAVNVNAC